MKTTRLNIAKLGSQIALAFGLNDGLAGTPKSTALHSLRLVCLTLYLRGATRFAHLRLKRLLDERRHVHARLLAKLTGLVGAETITGTQSANGSSTGQTHTKLTSSRWAKLFSSAESLLLERLEPGDALPTIRCVIACSKSLTLGQYVLRRRFCPIRQFGYCGLRTAATAATINDPTAFFAGYGFAKRFTQGFKLSAGVAHDCSVLKIFVYSLSVCL